jgi:hypothetical protein
VGFKSDQRSEVNETATIRRESPNGSDCERGAGVQSVGQGFTGLDFLVLLYQDKRTLIKGAVIRACLPARQGFKALDLLVLLHQVVHPDVSGAKEHHKPILLDEIPS